MASGPENNPEKSVYDVPVFTLSDVVILICLCCRLGITLTKNYL